jgi:hypothetical protein|tara:strand:+ start:470 stop:895 length:426 start_codon:yes stop_codon:yes gene_type:complete
MADGADFRYNQGVGNSAAYLVSGYPFLTGSNALAVGSEHEISFPTVTKRIVVINQAAPDILVHFASKTIAQTTGSFHYITLNSAEDSLDMSVKAERIYISNIDGSQAASYQIFAELTTIPTGSLSNMYISGSEWPGIQDQA